MYIFLQNDYCVIATDLLGSVKEVFQLSWEMIGDDSPTSTDREKIARYISNTPHFHEYFSKHKIKPTKDILCQLAGCKDYAIRIAQSFLVGKVNKPLERDLEEGLIDEFMRDVILLESEFYGNIWNIINTKWKKIKKNMARMFNDFSFNSEIELMRKIIDEHLTEPFINYTTTKYKNFSPYHHKQMWNLISKGTVSNLTDEEKKKLNKFYREKGNDKGELNKWTARFLIACQVLAKTDSYIAAHLAIYTALVKGKAQYRQKIHCDPSLSKYRMPSHNWSNGKIIMRNNS